MKRRLVSGVMGLGFVFSLSACSANGPLPTAPEDAGTPELSATPDPGQEGPFEKIVFIHWKRGFGPVETEPALEAPGDCFAFISEGALWKNVEAWEVLSSTSDDGIGASAVRSRTNSSINEWESHLSPAGDIFGAGSLGSTPIDPNAPDNHNVVQFGNDPRPGVIAVTTVWGILTGPVSMRRIVEWDMILDRDFVWSTSGEPGRMDLRNILTHEVGHALGLGHPVSTCTKETMYAFASEGETKKRTLHGGDVAGLNGLY